MIRATAGAALLLSLAACGKGAPAPEPESTVVPEELAGKPDAAPAVDSGVGTPMAERVATLGLLNKRNNLTQDITLKPGESRRVGDVVVRLSACERTPPWESPPETGAFVQVLVQDRPDADSQPEWRRIFSGWLFKNSPSLNVVEHPIYDVWVKDCAMSFPGQETAEAPSAAPRAAPSASPSPTDTPSPSPTPAEAAPAAADSTAE